MIRSAVLQITADAQTNLSLVSLAVPGNFQIAKFGGPANFLPKIWARHGGTPSILRSKMVTSSHLSRILHLFAVP
jgi:hypothetical protein